MRRSLIRAGCAAALAGSLASAPACSGASDSDEPPVAPDGGGDHGGASGSPPVPHECAIEAPTACPDPAPTYAEVEPIFAARCVVCHGGTPGGPWPLNTYGHVATWRDTIRAALLTCAMPPAGADVSIDPNESELVLAWLRCGMPF